MTTPSTPERAAYVVRRADKYYTGNEEFGDILDVSVLTINTAEWLTRGYPGSVAEPFEKYRSRIERLHAALGTAEEPVPSVPRDGLYKKFIVRRADGRDLQGEKHHKCDYLVLDLVHDAHAHSAVAAYVASCVSDAPALAEDLRRRMGISEHPAASDDADVQAVREAIDKIDVLSPKWRDGLNASLDRIADRLARGKHVVELLHASEQLIRTLRDQLREAQAECERLRKLLIPCTEIVTINTTPTVFQEATLTTPAAGAGEGT